MKRLVRKRPYSTAWTVATIAAAFISTFSGIHR